MIQIISKLYYVSRQKKDPQSFVDAVVECRNVGRREVLQLVADVATALMLDVSTDVTTVCDYMADLPEYHCVNCCEKHG